MSDAWAKKVARNILPLSRESESLKVSLSEWRYSGDCEDHEKPIEECQMCDHPNIRYQYRIVNQFTQFELRVGSECITKFSVPVLDEMGTTLSREDVEQLLAKHSYRARRDARTRRATEVLRELYRRGKSNELQRRLIGGIGKSYKDKESHSPKQMVVIAKLLREHAVPHSPRDFKVAMAKDKSKDDIRTLGDSDFRHLYIYLSPSQRQRADEIRSKA